MIQTFFRILAYGIQGFRRNIWLSVIAIITMTITLLTLTSFSVIDVVANKKYQEFTKDKIDYSIFVKDSATDLDISQLRTQIDQRSEVLGETYCDKSCAKDNYNKLFGDDPDLKGVVTDDSNPLPREINVKFTTPDSIRDFDTFVHQDRFKDIVDKTSYQGTENAIDNYLRTASFARIFGLSLSIFFTIVAILVILNTIRLTIYSRRTEVEVMRFVGATQGYIRGPFIVEGVLFGVISAVVAAIVSWFVLNQIVTLIHSTLAAGNTNQITDLFGDILWVNGSSTASTVLAELFLLQIGAGLLLGVLCSVVAIRRYLKE